MTKLIVFNGQWAWVPRLIGVLEPLSAMEAQALGTEFRFRVTFSNGWAKRLGHDEVFVRDDKDCFNDFIVGCLKLDKKDIWLVPADGIVGTC